MTLNSLTINFLNLLQNKCIRQIIGLKKFSHISNILKCLKIYNFDQLYTFSKLIFINSIHNNEICSDIFKYLMSDKDCSNRSNSFRKDFLFMAKNLKYIFNGIKSAKHISQYADYHSFIELIYKKNVI